MTSTPDAAPLRRPRLWSLLLHPRRTWPAYAADPPSGASVFIRYALPLAAIPAVAKAAGILVFGVHIYGVLFRPAPIMAAMSALLVYGLMLASTLILAFVIDVFSAVFNGEKGFGRAMLLSVFAHLPGWLGGVFLVLPAMGLLPPLGALTIAFTLYGLYLLYLGIGPVMRVAGARAGVYGALAVLVFLALWGASSLIITAFDRGVMAPAPGATLRVGQAEVNVDKLKRAARELRRALNSDLAPRPAASPDELQSLLHAELMPGYERLQVTGDAVTIGKLAGARARATYAKDKTTVTVTLADVGSLGGLADVVTLSSRKTEKGYETSTEIDGRITVERYDRTSNAGEYDVLVGHRFLVQARGQAPFQVLKDAVLAVPFDRLEAMAASAPPTHAK